MKRFRYINVSPSLLMLLFFLMLIPFVPATAFAYGGSAHLWASEQAAQLFIPENQQYIAAPNASCNRCHIYLPGTPPPYIIERSTKTPLFPELAYGMSHAWYEGEEPYNSDSHDYNNWEIIKWNAAQEDSYELIDWTEVWKPSPGPDTYPPLVDVTITHFWQPAFFGALGETYGASKNCLELNPNAWTKAKILWNAALAMWRAAPDDPEGKAVALGWAYLYLGHVVHLAEDMGEPAHTHQDLHNNTEKFELWLGDGPLQANLSWFTPGAIGAGDLPLNPGPAAVTPKVPELGDMLYPPEDQAAILGTANSVHYRSSDCYPNINDDTLANDRDLFPELSPAYAANNLPKLFYLMFVTNMIGDYCPSSGDDGQTDDKTGWLRGYSPDDGFPTVDADGNDFQNSDRLDDNDTYFNQLTQVCYKASFQVAHSVIDLFRKTIDNVPPDTTVVMPDPNGLNGWYKSPFTVQFTGATDHGNPGYRPSGVWKVWGLYDGTPPADENAVSWYIHEDSAHHIINCLSTDMAGNVDTRDIEFKYDGTPPVITFPGLRPNYLTSESFTVSWSVMDATSGVDADTVKAYLDGQQVNSGNVFNLAQMAGLHTLLVHACDNAGNCIDVPYNFEVWINARGWCFSVIVNDKTQGNAMSCAVEFPAPYKVALIDLNTTTLAVKGTIDLTKSDPVVGQTVLLPGQLLGGVGDSDGNRIRDRKIQFRKDYFVNALGGQVGDIPSVVRGGLLPNGQPRFISPVTVPVFKTPKK